MVQVGGVGDRTNNLFDLKKAVKKKYINSNGDEATSFSPSPENALNHSDYVSIESNVNYTFTCTTSQNYSLENTIALCWFDENKNILSRNTKNVRGNINNYSITATSPSTAKYLIVNFIAYVDDAVFYLNEGTTTFFEPYGYKIPIVIERNRFNSKIIDDYSLQTTNYANAGKPIPFAGRCATLEAITLNDFNNVVLTFDSKVSNTKFMYSLFNDESFVSRTAGKISGTIINTTGANKLYICFYSSDGPVLNTDLTDVILLSENDTYQKITTNIYLNSPIGENESISLSDTNTNIPTIRGTNVLTVNTAVQPSKVYIKISTKDVETNETLQINNIDKNILLNETEFSNYDDENETEFSNYDDGENETEFSNYDDDDEEE